MKQAGCQCVDLIKSFCVSNWWSVLLSVELKLG